MRKRVSGSFTLEAAFIVPVIIFAIVGLIWVIMYLYNSVKLTADADMAAFMTEKEYAEDRMPDSYAEKDIARELSGYIGAGVDNASVIRNGRSIAVKAEVELDLPEEGILGSLVSGIRNIKRERESDIPNKTEITRIIKAASELLKVIIPDKKDESSKGK